MEDIEGLLRTAGVVVTLLMAVLLLRDAGRSLVGRLGALFSLGVASYLVCSARGFHELSPFIHIPLLTLCVSNPVFFWLLARALFDDTFRLAPVHGLLVVALLLGKGACALVGGTVAAIGGLLIQAIGFGLAGHALWVAYAGRADDLSEERRAVRLPLVIGVGIYSVVILVAELVLGTKVAPAPVRLIHVGIILSLAVTFALRLVLLRADDLLIPQSATLQPTYVAPEEPDIDAALLGRLNALMERQEAWREEGLTIGKLSVQLGIPEYRLRRLINKGLGHRNFSSYVNRYRIEAARRDLTDPAKARLPVLTIALDLGFGSIGPFNRAFKDGTGMTPTEFRKAHLSGGVAGNDLADS